MPPIRQSRFYCSLYRPLNCWYRLIRGCGGSVSRRMECRRAVSVDSSHLMIAVVICVVKGIFDFQSTAGVSYDVCLAPFTPFASMLLSLLSPFAFIGTLMFAALIHFALTRIRAVAL